MAECGYCRDCRWLWRSTTGDDMACNRIYEMDSLAVIDVFLGAAPGTLTVAHGFGCVQWEAKEGRRMADDESPHVWVIAVMSGIIVLLSLFILMRSNC